MTFTSNALTTDEWFSDLARYTLNKRKKEGISTPKLGTEISVDFTKITTPQKYTEFLERLNEIDRIMKGGMAAEGTDHSSGYMERRFRMVSSNGLQHMVSTPTRVGYNFDLTQPQATEKMTAVLGSHVKKIKELTTTQARRLFDLDIREYEDTLNTVNPSLYERERIGLLMYLYNTKRGMSGELRSAVQSGNSNRMAQAIINQSKDTEKYLGQRSAITIVGGKGD